MLMTVIVADVYAAGETPIEGIDARRRWSMACAAHGHRNVLGLAGP